MLPFWKNGDSSLPAPGDMDSEGSYVSSATVPSRKYAKYPPEAASVEIIGYIKNRKSNSCVQGPPMPAPIRDRHSVSVFELRF